MSSLQAEVRETVTMQQLINLAKTDPVDVFIDWPLDSIRKACLETMVSGHPIYCYEEAEWAESQIKYYLSESVRDYKTANDLLTWYLFGNSKLPPTLRIPLTVKAISFAIDLYFSHKFSSFEGKILKGVFGRLRKDDRSEIYLETPRVKDFLKDLIICIFGIGIVRRIRFGDKNYPMYDSERYYEESWNDLQRALDIVLLVKDYTFIPIIDEALCLILEGSIYPDFGPKYTKRFHIIILRDAIEELKKECIKAVKDRGETELQRARSAM